LGFGSVRNGLLLGRVTVLDEIEKCHTPF
jgi:hypothetical protein